MTQKSYCDECRKEIETSIFSRNYIKVHGMINDNFFENDFCSLECLQTHIEKMEDIRE